MAPVTALTIVKRMHYRSETAEEWSNKYWLTGTPPATPTEWRTLFDNLAAYERACYLPWVEIIRAFGHADNDPHAFSVWNLDLTLEETPLPGQLPVVAGMAFAGDQAGMVEWRTQRKNSRGKWIYLRKYFHGGNNSAGDADYIDAGTADKYQILADTLKGVGVAGRRLRSQFNDEVIQEAMVSPFTTTRTLKRRGKKKKTP